MSSNQRGAARRLALIEATRIALLERGSAGVRVRDVAEEAGISPSAILYHYPSFDDLVVAAIAHGLDGLHLRRTRAVDSHGEPAARLLATVDACLASDRDDEEVRLLSLAAAQADESFTLRALLGSAIDRATFTYQSILETGAATGIFRLSDGSLAVARNLAALEYAYGQMIVNEIPGFDHATALTQMLAYVAGATGARLSPAAERRDGLGAAEDDGR
ncbi:TetR family transcriptional regulator [Conexibacter arvalis]|uniref:AcrR family transcriptional regulator n=1 Tax=Conexibacter arvalis TaxID=912552 RepID=A0A840IJP5_9ACTN|nr:AcrR family transcriptional regulator [Conexibacter arvalis]